MTTEFSDTIPGTSVGRGLDKDDLIVIAGAGGFIAGSLTRYFHEQGFTRIRAIDNKPLPDWYQRVPGVESLSMDLSDEAERDRAVRGRGRRSTTWPPTWAAWASSSASASSACAASSSTRT